MADFIVDDKIKRIAYKELVEDINQQIKEKENAVQKLEIEYFKKWLLNNVSKDNTEVAEVNYRKEITDIMEKIKEEENSIGDLELTKGELQDRYDYKYGEKK